MIVGERERLATELVVLCFSADEAFDGTYPTNVVVTDTGSCTYIPPGIFKSTCKIDITWFPFDDQDCKMKFGSWTYNGFKVKLPAYIYLIWGFVVTTSSSIIFKRFNGNYISSIYV